MTPPPAAASPVSRVFLAALSACLLLLLLPTGPAARGDDEAPAPQAAAQDAPIVTRLIDVRAFTRGRPDFLPPVLGTASPHEVSDDDHPLFGGEGEEPWLPVGTIDEIAERIRQAVDPVTWDVVAGASVRPQGEGLLIVRTTPQVQEHVARYLADLEASVLRCFTVDLCVVRLEPGEALPPTLGRAGTVLPPKAAEALLQRAAPGGALQVTTVLGQKAVVWDGLQQNLVHGYDDEVAKGATIADPIVGTANLGLAASVRVTGGNARRGIRLEVDAALVLPETSESSTARPGQVIELPREEIARLKGDLLLTAGLWHAVAGSLGGDEAAAWVFLVRIRPAQRQVAASTAAALEPWPSPGTGPLAFRAFDVGDLGEVVASHAAPTVNLVPSNFTPPEPPELPEPSAIYPPDALVDLIQELAAPGTWKRTGSSIDVRGNRLVVVQTEPILDAVERGIEALRHRLLFTVDTTAVVVDVPRRLAEALTFASEGRRAPYLPGERALEALAAARVSGEATSVGRVRIPSMTGARSVLVQGRRIAYVQDYAVEIADGASIANPIVRTAFSGLVVDVIPSLTPGGDAVFLDVRFDATRLHEPIRQGETPHGLVDLPAVDVLRLRTDLVVPLGQTAVVGMGGHGERVRVLLVRPTIRRYGE